MIAIGGITNLPNLKNDLDTIICNEKKEQPL